MSLLSIAHRGYSDVHKDNSENAIRAAIEHNFDMIEIDVQVNLDNTLVLHHDLYCKESNMMICHMNTEDTNKHNILTLEYVFTKIWKPHIIFLLDLKGDNQTAYSLVNMLSRFPDILSTIYVTSHYYNHIYILQSSNTNVKLGMSLSNAFPAHFYEDDSWIYPLTFVCIDWSLITYDFIHCMKMRKKHILLFTVHNTIEYQYVIEHFRPHVHGIITNILC